MGEEEGTAKAQRQEGSHSVGTSIPLRSHHCHHQCRRLESGFSKTVFVGFFCLFLFCFLLRKGKEMGALKDCADSTNWSQQKHVVLGRLGDRESEAHRV